MPLILHPTFDADFSFLQCKTMNPAPVLCPNMAQLDRQLRMKTKLIIEVIEFNELDSKLCS